MSLVFLPNVDAKGFEHKISLRNPALFSVKLHLAGMKVLHLLLLYYQRWLINDGSWIYCTCCSICRNIIQNNCICMICSICCKLHWMHNTPSVQNIMSFVKTLINNKPHSWTTNKNLTPENTHFAHTMYSCLVAESSDEKI